MQTNPVLESFGNAMTTRTGGCDRLEEASDSLEGVAVLAGDPKLFEKAKLSTLTTGVQPRPFFRSERITFGWCIALFHEV